MNTTDFGINQGLVEELYIRYRENPATVDDVWRRFFDGLSDFDKLALITGNNGALQANAEAYAAPQSNGQVAEAPKSTRHSSVPAAAKSLELLLANELQGRVSALVHAYRTHGHLFAKIDPLGLLQKPANALSLKNFGLDEVDPSTVFATTMPGASSLTLTDLVARLNETYCRTIGVEYTEIENPEARAWLEERMESTANHLELTREDELRILEQLTDAEVFEQFVHTSYVGAKRFSLEGGESLIPMLELMIEQGAELGASEFVFGMAHRGRLNVLVNVLKKKVQEIFFGFEDKRPELFLGRGDVKYHLGYSSDRTTRTGKSVHLTMAFNPSHLEIVNPVIEGRVRAKQDRVKDTERKSVVPVLIHGDAAFIGQGIVAETLNLCKLDGYRTGGTLHIVINNQLGFTTNPSDSRSTRYSTDVARIVRAPVFHVNGEDLEAVAHVSKLATEYRQRFHDDVVIDMYCYRRYGHNEADEPRFTQPVMYSVIDKKPGPREVYVQNLESRGIITQQEADVVSQHSHQRLERALDEIRSTADFVVPNYSLQAAWSGYRGGPDSETSEVPTTVSADVLSSILIKTTDLPAGFTPNSKIARLLDERKARAHGEKPFDWGTAETLAYASLVAEGRAVRLSGQDARRGTFTHRHAAVYDSVNGQRYIPLEHIAPNQARFEVYDSPLSEAGVLGFDLGYSMDSPDSLVVWEAQFGDFANGAQVIIDQFLTSSEDKWHRLSGLVLLLPHGSEGQGPEHSSARLERFLAACAEDNIQVCNLTTPAQIFHALRRQVLRPYRKPLVVMSPKSLLRHPKATSTLAELATGSFQRVIGDTSTNPSKTRRVILCAGKVYYDLVAAREERKIEDIAIVRFEQLYPLSKAHAMKAVEPYKNAELVWVQEEPLNMGAWPFMQRYLVDLLGGKTQLRVVSRPASASPATGSNAAHKMEQAQLIKTALDS